MFTSKLLKCLRGVLNSGRKCKAAKKNSRLALEALEDRFMPAIVAPALPIQTMVDHGGPVINNPHVELIFWG